MDRPFAHAASGHIGETAGRDVVLGQIIGPGDALLELGSRFRAEPVEAGVEQRLGLGRSVVDDQRLDEGVELAGDRIVGDALGAGAARLAAGPDEILRPRQIGQMFGAPPLGETPAVAAA